MLSLFDVHAHHPEKTFVAPPNLSLSTCFSGFSTETNAEVMAFASKNENCIFSLGLAPQEVIRSENPDALFTEFENTCLFALESPLKRKFAAIGECGLDYHWAKGEDKREEERKIFSRVIAFANSHSMPLVIHSRSAEGDCIKMLQDAGCKRVLMHCFGGTLKQAKEAEALGYPISIPPVKNSERKKVIKELQLISLTVESDAPYIGKSCADTYKSVEMIAEYKGLPTDEVLSATNANARKFFGV